MVVPNAANTAPVVGRLREIAATGDATVEDRSVDEAIVAIQGPRALELASEVLTLDVGAIAYLGVARVDVDGSGEAVVARTGYTGEPGCEVVAPGPVATRLWDDLVGGGATRCGLGARDTLRLEMGYPLHGHELSREVDPYQARLGWTVHRDHDFVGRDALEALREAGPTRRLWGLRVEGRRPLRQGLAVRIDGRLVGAVTSGSFSPTLQTGIGLAFLDDPLGPGDEVVVDVRGRDVAAQVVRPPFVERDPRG
jgi:aminomethyltransferase